MSDRVLLGRDRELGLIDALLGDAREGRGRGLLISGEAGIGKTSLLDEARERASGMRVIEAIGVEGELHLPFAALGEVAEPLVDRIGELRRRRPRRCGPRSRSPRVPTRRATGSPSASGS